MKFSGKNFYEPFLRKFFPPPSFLKMGAVGLDISDRKIRYLSFKNKGSKRKIDVYGEVAIPEGALSGGHINKPNVVSSIISGISGKLKKKFVRVSLPEEKAYIYQTQVPKMVGVDIRESVSYTLEGNVPIKPNEAVFDYVIVPSRTKDSDHLDVIVTVIPQKVSEIYELITIEAGLFPLSFEIGSQAIARAVTNTEDNQVRLILNINETKTGFSIVSRGLVRFTSTIKMGVADIDKNLASLMDISVKEVREAKRRIIVEGEQDMDLFFKLMEIVKPINSEIKKLQSYWKTHGAGRSGLSKEIVEIILVGRDTAIPAVAEYLESMTNIKTSIAKVWQNAISLNNNIPDIPFLDSLDYAGAIGLAIGGGSNK